MSETYIKCACRVCGGRIEFPSHAVGMSIGCPHCGGTTELYAPPTSLAAATAAAPVAASPPPIPQPPRMSGTPAGSRLQVANPPPPPPPEVEEAAEPAAGSLGAPQGANWIGISLAVVSVLLVVIGALMYWNNAKQGKSVLPSRGDGPVFSKRSTSKRIGSKPAAKDDEQDASTAPKTPSTAKSLDDLKVSTITLQRTPGSSLVYAVGTVRNDSDHQRFGVRLELDVFDSGGKRIGPAKDYIAVIEPHKEWRFRALVPFARTVSAKVAKITEQE